MGVLLLVRHGQASFGADDYDVLSPLGHQQAALLGARLAPLAGGVRRVLSGSMRRQRDTAAELVTAAGIEVPVETDARWDEYDVDDIVGAVPPRPVTDNASFQLVLDEALTRWTAGAHDAGYRESWPQFSARVLAALGEGTSGPGTTVVASSAGTIAVCAAALVDLPPPGWTRLARVQVNASVTKVVTGRSGTSLVAYNDAAHLEAPGTASYR